jgi:hypothetical protein
MPGTIINSSYSKCLTAQRLMQDIFPTAYLDVMMRYILPAFSQYSLHMWGLLLDYRYSWMARHLEDQASDFHFGNYFNLLRSD